MKEIIKNAYDLFRLYSDQFYQDMTQVPDLSFGVIVAALTVTVTILLVWIYYYILDNTAMAKKSTWFMITIGVAGILGLMGYLIANNQIVEYYQEIGEDIPAQYGTDLLYFGLTSFFWGAVFFVVFSFLIKAKSTNTSHVPFSLKK